MIRNTWLPILGGMFIVVVVAVIVVNRWTATELDEQPVAVRQVAQQPARLLEQNELIAEAKLPVIDPYNDPLAPARPTPKEKTHRVQQSGYIQEAPQSDPILLQ